MSNSHATYYYQPDPLSSSTWTVLPCCSCSYSVDKGRDTDSYGRKKVACDLFTCRVVATLGGELGVWRESPIVANNAGRLLPAR